MSREQQASKFLKSMGWLRSYEDTESAARSVAEAAQNKIDELKAENDQVRNDAQRQIDKLNLRIAQLKSDPPCPTPFMHYAAAALTGLLSNMSITNTDAGNYENISRWASGYAAAMLRTYKPIIPPNTMEKVLQFLEKISSTPAGSIHSLPIDAQYLINLITEKDGTDS